MTGSTDFAAASHYCQSLTTPLSWYLCLKASIALRLCEASVLNQSAVDCQRKQLFGRIVVRSKPTFWHWQSSQSITSLSHQFQMFLSKFVSRHFAVMLIMLCWKNETLHCAPSAKPKIDHSCSLLHSPFPVCCMATTASQVPGWLAHVGQYSPYFQLLP